MKLPTVCRIISKIWLGLSAIVILIGLIATWYFRGWGAVQDTFNPFNISNFIVVVITIGPGLLLDMLANDLDRGERKAAFKKLALLPVALLLIAGLFVIGLFDYSIRKTAEQNNGVVAPPEEGLDPSLEADIASEKIVKHLTVDAADRRRQRYDAIAGGRLDVLKRLTQGSLRADADASTPPLLFYALMKKQEAIARYLVETGTNVNAGHDDITPLFLAVMERYLDLVRAMISKGADINAKWIGGTPFFLAVSLGTYNEDEILELFPATGPRPNVSVTDPHGRTAVTWCIINGYQRVASWLLDLGANVNAVDHKKMTLLEHSVYRGTVNITRDLVRLHAPVDAADENGFTPLMQALFYLRQIPDADHCETVRVLIKGGANVNAKSKIGDTPVMFAAAVCQNDLMEEMIKAGADVNAVNEAGHTALMAAAANGFTRVVEALLAQGANITIRAKDGKTALKMAKQAGHKDTEVVLLSKGATE